MTGTHSPGPSSSSLPTQSSTSSPPRRPPRANPPTQPLPPVPGRPPLNSSHSSPPRIPSRLSGNITSRKEINSPKLAPSPLSPPPASSSKPRTSGRPDLRQTSSANDARTRSLTCSQQRQQHQHQRDAGLAARSRGASDAQFHRSRSSGNNIHQLPPGAYNPLLTRNQTPPPPSSFSATSATNSPLPSFHPFGAADDDDRDRDTTTTEFGALNDPTMSSSDGSRAPTPQSRFHSSKLLSKIRAKASAHSLRSSTPTTESSGFSSPRTSEETLTELFDEDLSTPASIKAAIRQRARTLSRSSPVPQAPSKLRLSKNLESHRSSVRFPEEEPSPTDCEEEEEEDASFATVKPPMSYQRPAAFEVKDVVIRNGMRVAPQPVWEVPYPVGFSCAALQSDDKTYDLVKALQPDRSSPSFYHFKHAPSMVLDLGCGVGRWVIEAASEWTKTRFVGLDLMDLQPDLSEKQYEEIRDRVQWVHSNFLQYKLPFHDAQFDFIRMSFVALAVPESKWRFLVKEIRRILKPSGVLEWIDEEPVFGMSPSYCPDRPSTFTHAKELQSEFRDMLRARKLDNALRCFSDEVKSLKGIFEMSKPKFDKFKLWLPGYGTELQSRSGYESGLMRSHSPAAAAAGAGTFSRTHQMAKELKRSLGGSGDSVSSSAPAAAQERASLDGVEKALPAIPRPHFTPQGLMVIAERTDEKGNKYHENNLLPLTAEDIEVHAGRNYQVLLNSREAVWAQRQVPASKNGETTTLREKFDDQLWKYECERWARLHLPLPTWYDSEDDHQSGSRIHRRKSPRPLSMTVMMPPTGQKPTIVRSISVMTCKSL